MPKVAVYNQKGEKVEEINLNEEIWGVEVNKETLYDAIVMQRASLRQGTHKTKTRGEVSGGGKTMASKELVVLVTEVLDHQFGVVVELFLDHNLVIMVTILTANNAALH